MIRAKHSLSHYKLATFDQGNLVPVACYEVLPGDSVQMSTSALIRVSPLVSPVMHPVSVRIHHWFVPYRLVWAGWEEFITGGPDGQGGSSGAFPTIAAGAGFTAGGLLDYLGVPPGVALGSVSALPVRAYNKIFNENYRDEDLVTALAVPTTSGADATSPVTIQNIAWEKDYFTSARLTPQKGPEVTLPLGTTAPVTGIAVQNGAAYTGNAAGHTDSTGANPPAGTNWATPTLLVQGDNVTKVPNIMADLAAATAVDVNTVRLAFAVQRYQEARAQYGSRYVEYLRYLGVRSSDARLQRPEYLGGGKQTISFSEILQTGTNFDANTGVGSLKGHGIAALRSRRWRRFFEEHGVVLSLASVRPRTMYANGVPRMWSRTTKEDFWQKELEQIGQQEVLNKEIYAAHASPTGTFGYQDRYAEYRHQQSSIAGEFRTSTYNFWHMARLFGSTPALNAAFVTADPTTRVYASTTTDQLLCMFSHSIQARRLVGKKTIGRIL